MIRVTATPDHLDVTPARPATLTLKVDNTDPVARTVTLRLVGIDPAWVAWPEEAAVADGAPGPTLTLGANEWVELPITVTLPPGFPAGAQLIGIEAAIEGVARPALGSLQLGVADIDGVSLGLSPASFRGGRTGRFRLNIVNRGKDPIDLQLSGRPAGEDPAELRFRFKPQEFTLRSDERVRVKATVTGKRPIVGAPRIRPMTIVAQSNSAPLHADARFTQRPLLSRRVLRVFAIFVALSMWAGALVTAVRWTGDSAEDQTAADASAEVAPDETTTTLGPGESVMVDTDGDGEPDTAMVDTDGDGQPDTPADQVVPGEDGLPSGPFLSGQVTGVADRSNITVSGSYVALATAIPAKAAGDEVAAQGVGDGRKGKLYASGLTTVDSDDPAKADRSTVTDENGFWKLAGLAEGNWELTFTKAGFATRTLVVPVEEGREPEPIEVAMAAGDGTVGGLVSTAAGPLGGALVTVTDGSITFTTTTPTEGDVGRWQIGGLSTPGTYLVTAERRGFGTETASVTLGASESNFALEQTLVEGVGSIGGTVSGGGAGLGGIVVTAANETVSRQVTTLTESPDGESPAGSFLLPQLPIPGDYTLTITGDNWVPQTQLVHLEGNLADLNFELVATTASISGTVEGPNGALEAVGITVSQETPLVKTLSASGGAFELEGLAPGTYTVTFEFFGYETQSKIVELAIGDEAELAIEMVPTPDAQKAGDATVQGIVRSGTTGQPITGVAVAFQGKTATSAEGGTFTLAGLAAGTGDLALSHAMYQATARTVRLGVKATVQVDITMLPLGGLQGQVTDLTATPVSGVSVTVAAQSGTAAVTVPNATTDANGEYSILQAFPTGSYIATFSKTGYGTQTREFEAAAGSNSVADIQLVELGTITGGLQEPGGGVGGFLSLTGVTVKVEKLVNGVVSGAPVFGPVVRNGSYTVSGLEAGDYRVTATHPDFPDPGVRDLLGLKLREVRDGGIVLARGAAAVSGQIYFSTGTGRQGVIGATITAQVVTGYNILPTFPFVSPLLQSASTTSVAQGTLVDSDDDGAVDDAAPVDGFYVIDPQPVSGSIANYTVAATGFTTRIQAITSPTAGGSGDIVLIPNPKDISGTVDLSDNAVGTSVVAKLSGAVLSEDITLPTLTTNASGEATFAFNDLPPGDYTVTFTSADYHSNTDTITITSLSPEANAMGTTILDRESSIEITVRTNNGTGALVAGASVTITRLSDSTTQTKVTNVSGEALFTELRSGTYRVSVSRAGFDSATSAAAATATMVGDIPLAVGQSRADTAAELVTLQRHPDVTVNVTGILANLTGDGSTTTALTNANVTLTPVAGGAVVNLLHSAGGAYTATLVPPATYRLDVTAASHEAFSLGSVAISAGPNVSQSAQLNKFGSLVVYLDKTIGGVTTDFADADHTATPATITATPTAGGSPITLTKCAAVPVLPCPVANPAVGTWVANNVPNGTYSVVAAASGYASQTVEISGVVAGSTFSNAPTPVLALTKFATLTVNVTKDPDGGGVLTSAPIAATTVTATRTDGTVLPMAATATVGTYQLTSITPGTYNISVQLTDHVTGTASNVVVGSGSSPTVTVDLISLPDAAVTVVDGVPTNITTAVVLATPSGGGTAISFSHDSGTPGTYRASKLPTGAYTLSVSAPGFATFTGVAGNLVSTTSGTITGATAVTLTVAASIRVNIYNDTRVVSAVDNPATPLVDETVVGTELDDALVVIRAVGGTNPASRVRFSGDDGSGLAVFNELTPTAGFTYSLTVSKAGYATHEATGITLSSGGSPTIDVVLEPLAIISFSITGSPGGAAVNGATITATQGTTQITGVPLFTGVYVFPGLPAGDWSIAVAAPNHGTYPAATTFASLAALDSTDALAVADGNVVAGENRTYALSLSAWPTQSVTVDSDGTGAYAAVGGALVTATPLSGSGTAYVLSETATAGTYTSPPLAPGVSYTLSASKADHTLAATTTTGVVAAGTALSTVPNLLLAPHPTQSIDVTRASNGAAAAPFSGATVTATRAGGPTYTFSLTSTAGRYISPPLAPGAAAYTITASNGTDVLASTQVTAAVTAGTSLSLLTGGSALALSAVPTLQVDVVAGFNADTDGNAGNDPVPTSANGNGTTVLATPTAGGPAITLAPTGVDGRYSTSNLTASTSYAITATKAGHTQSAATGSPFTATAGAANGDVDVTLLQHPNLTVTATAGTTTPAAMTAAAANGAVVTLTPEAGGSPIALGATANDGEYSVTAIPPASNYDLVVAKDGYSFTAVDVDVFLGRQILTSLAVQLLQHPSLAVEVVSDLGAADLDAATVTATRSTGEVVALTSIGSGEYRAGSVPPGTYTIRAVAPFHDAETFAGVVVVAGIDKVVDTDPGTGGNQPISLPRYGSLTVSVFSRVDPDGAGATVPTDTLTDGAAVTAMNTTTGEVLTVPQNASVAAGDYSLSDVPPGTYAIAATRTGHDGASAGSTVTVNATATPGTPITSSVTLPRWPDLVVDVDGVLNTVQSALTGATVTAAPTAGGATITLGEVGSTGVYSVSGITPGPYAVTASKAGYTAVAANVTATAGWFLSSSGTPLTRDLPQHPTVTVLVDDENVLAAAGDDTDLSGALVQLVHNTTGEIVVLGETGTAGTYDATTVVPGSYTLSVSADDFATFTDAAVTVTGGADLAYDTDTGDGEADQDPVVLQPAATLTVTVNSRIGGVNTVLDGATVTALNTTTGEAFAVTQVNGGSPGDYRTANLPAGTYTIEATAPDHAADSSPTSPAVIGAGDEATAIIELLAYPTLTVDVFQEDGDGNAANNVALTGATVTAAPTGGGAVVTLGEVGVTGVYRAAAIAPGVTYLVTAAKSGFTTATYTTAAIAAGTTPATGSLTLTRATTVTVTVRSENDADGAGVAVTASLSELTSATVTVDGTVDTVLTHVSGGVYRGTVTAAGLYDIVVTAPGHTSQTLTNGGAQYSITQGGVDISETVNLAAVGATVGGTVVNLTNGAIGSVSVTATNGAATIGPVTTNGSGVYSFTGATALEPGVWSLKFDATDLAPLTISVNVPVGTAIDTGSTVDVDVTLAPAGGAINGQVLVKASALAESIGNPATGLAGATINLRLDGSVTVIRTAAPSETTSFWFGFGGLDAGTYDLEFDRASGTDLTVENIAVAGGQIVTRSHTFVADEVNAVITTSLEDGVTDVNAVDVTLTNPALISPAETQTTASGTTTFTVPYGTYTMTVTQPTGYVSIDPISRTIVVLPTGTTNIDQRYSAVGTISGTTATNDDSIAAGATFDDGVLAGATVTVFNTTTGYRQEVTTAADGSYTAGNVPIGTGYSVSFEHPDYVTDINAGVTVTVDSNLATTAGDVTSNGDLHKLASFTIAVKDDQPVDLDGVAVAIWSAIGGTGAVTQYVGGLSAIAQGDDLHTFLVTGVDPVAFPTIYVRGTKAAYSQLTDLVITVKAGDNDPTTPLVLTRNGTVNITVTGLNAGHNTVTMTFSWTSPAFLGGGAATATDTFTDSDTSGSVSIPANTNVQWTIPSVTGPAESYVVNGGATTVAVTQATNFTVAPGSTSTLVGNFQA